MKKLQAVRLNYDTARNKIRKGIQTDPEVSSLFAYARSVNQKHAMD